MFYGTNALCPDIFIIVYFTLFLSFSIVGSYVGHVARRSSCFLLEPLALRVSCLEYVSLLQFAMFSCIPM